MSALLDLYERTDRACLGTDPEIFFPYHTAQGGPAKTVCASCPVMDECLQFAIDTGQKFGIWGGMDPDERAAEVRRRNKEARIAAGLALDSPRRAHARLMRDLGYSPIEIAAQLRVAVATVEKYLRQA